MNASLACLLLLTCEQVVRLTQLFWHALLVVDVRVWPGGDRVLLFQNKQRALPVLGNHRSLPGVEAQCMHDVLCCAETNSYVALPDACSCHDGGAHSMQPCAMRAHVQVPAVLCGVFVAMLFCFQFM